MEELNKKEVVTNDYKDVKAMQDAIVKNSTEFEKLGLAKLKGSGTFIVDERSRLINEIKNNNVAQCDACNQIISSVKDVPVILNVRTFKEAERIQKEAKDGTNCQCCGNEAKVISLKLDVKKAIALIEIVKFYRHNPDADISKYYTKEDFFGVHLPEFEEIFEDFEQLHHWDLISRMPTRPDKVVYKDGWYGITENGIKFVQREIGVPKTVHTYNGETDSFDSDFITIEEILNHDELNYDELIKVE